MSSILLPSSPGIRSAKPRLLDWGGRLVPILGGETQTLLRLGTRWSFEFVMPPLRTEPVGRNWVAKLAQAKLDGAIMPFIQDGFDVGAPGAVTVNGGGQSGSLLAVKGATAVYPFRPGQFFSLIHGGRRYLHMVTAQVIADDAGLATLPLLPMLRVIPDDGDVVDMVPKIEGSLIGQDFPWDVLTTPHIDVGTVRIDEDA
jgi:hypothetical protein